MTFNLGRVRDLFPILSRTVHGKPLVYLDSAATSLTPEPVLAEITDYYRQVAANVHRGRSELSERGTELFERARERIARFLGARSAREVVFTSNCTAALNLVARGLRLARDCTVITTLHEHHSTLSPWLGQANVRYLQGSPLAPIDPDEVRRVALDSPGQRRILVVSHVSNVTGIVQPISDLCRVARETGMLSVVDAAQSAPHLKLDVNELGCDFLAFAGHKALGPMGTGVLYGKSEQLAGLAVDRVGGGALERVGQDGYELREVPARFEAGTPDVPGVLGLARALELLDDLGFDALARHGEALRKFLLAELADDPAFSLLTSTKCAGVPTMSLVPRGLSLDVQQLCMALSDNYGIMTRAGQHCAQPLFHRLRIPGALRVSAYIYNTPDELEYFCQSLRELARRFS